MRATVLLACAIISANVQAGTPDTRFAVAGSGGKPVWLLDKSRHRRFFSLGVCCVDTGQPVSQHDPKNPAYSAFAHYPDSATWADETLKRLTSWHFNTVGAWSNDAYLLAPKCDVYFTPILHMGSAAGAPWRDMWDPKIVAIMDQVAASGIKDHRGDGRVVGYFSDNELGWWTGALFDWAWRGAYSRAVVLDVLARHYGRNWGALMKDFVPDGAHDFRELARRGRLYLRPGGNGISGVHEYIYRLADRYYSLCRTLIKKHDPGALVLGDRYISGFYPEVAAAAGKWCDIVSTNLNADWSDGTFTPFYLRSLERITGKPLLISEYYMAASQNRSGDLNNSSGFPVVKDQAERARGFLRSTSIFLHDPRIVGAHWFQYYDEPGLGRGDGENYNMGLVDVDNEPYQEMTAASTSLDLVREHLVSTSAKVPGKLAPTRVPTVTEAQGVSLEFWPRDAAILAQTGGDPRGDAFAVCTESGANVRNVYLALYWNEDRFFETFYKKGRVPIEDEPKVEVTTSGSSPISLTLPDNGPLVSGDASIVKWSPGVRSTLIVRIPATWFRLAAAARALRGVPLDIRLTTRGRAYSMRWSAGVLLPLGKKAVSGSPSQSSGGLDGRVSDTR